MKIPVLKKHERSRYRRAFFDQIAESLEDDISCCEVAKLLSLRPTFQLGELCNSFGMDL